MIRQRVLFFGKVQGVGFRFFCQEAAHQKSVSGWVKNCSDGSVEMEVEGEQHVLDELLLHLRRAHPWARVDRYESMEITPQNNPKKGFEIHY